MRLIVPMSGQGSRFKAAGYTEIKPLITVEGKPVIAHVLAMFPEIDDVIFVCNEEHLATTSLRQILLELKPNALILSIPSHKLGPVHALTYTFPYLSDTEDVAVSYCDFTQCWDFASFQSSLQNTPLAGAVPAYTGFHPHLLHKNFYAGIRVDERGFMQEIKEKHCFTENPEACHHSSGIYYFGEGALLKHYCQEMITSGDTLNGEYYVSMIYPRLLRDGLLVSVPPITHFMQWGTPEDLEEYEAWSRLIHHEHRKEKAYTAIPQNREHLVTIPYQPNTSEYGQSHNYWHQHFLSVW